MEWQILVEKIIQIIIGLMVSIGLITGAADKGSPAAQTNPIKPESTTTIAENPIPTHQAIPTQPPIPTRVVTLMSPHPLRPEPGSVCGYDSQIESLIAELEQADWAHWIELLSGEKPVQMNGESYTILTRNTEAMFTGNPKARAYEFVLEQLRQWGYQDDIDLFEQEFRPMIREPRENWKNIVVTIPGKDPELAHEQILLTAHLDSTSVGQPEEHSPGADDNGSGVATLLEAARVFRGLDFRRTIKIVFFSGEEQGLNGSRAYVRDYARELDDILGVFNLDMFGYDADKDRCFEIHAGWMTESNLVGGCLADTVEAYNFGIRYDYIVEDAITASDHSIFWREGVGAIEVLENFRNDEIAYGCGDSDINPHYHTEQDLIANMNLDTGHAIAKAAIGAVARMAEPVRNNP